MSRDVLVSLLRQGSTGSEILSILETIAAGDAAVSPGASAGEPTADPIDF
jgi:hypothetical protein